VLVMRARAGESFLVGDAGRNRSAGSLPRARQAGHRGARFRLIQRKETQITRDENITARRSVRQQSISSLLNKVAFPPVARPVKNLTDACIMTTKCISTSPKKY